MTISSELKHFLLEERGGGFPKLETLDSQNFLRAPQATDSCYGRGSFLEELPEYFTGGSHI